MYRYTRLAPVILEWKIPKMSQVHFPSRDDFFLRCRWGPALNYIPYARRSKDRGRGRGGTGRRNAPPIGQSPGYPLIRSTRFCEGTTNKLALSSIDGLTDAQLYKLRDASALLSSGLLYMWRNIPATRYRCVLMFYVLMFYGTAVSGFTMFSFRTIRTALHDVQQG